MPSPACAWQSLRNFLPAVSSPPGVAKHQPLPCPRMSNHPHQHPLATCVNGMPFATTLHQTPSSRSPLPLHQRRSHLETRRQEAEASRLHVQPFPRSGIRTPYYLWKWYVKYARDPFSLKTNISLSTNASGHDTEELLVDKVKEASRAEIEEEPVNVEQRIE